ncbi:MAG: hypothetical protein KIT72_14140 [Polyangiaceae bacterium]|nr:hypothetical protein [Polyangiaceae bacterium]MCW5791553.1 hypothetical protein [Polyangiaceae bacterium]
MTGARFGTARLTSARLTSAPLTSVLLALAWGCQRGADPAPGEQVEPGPPALAVPAEEAPERRCAARIQSLTEAPELPGAPGFERTRSVVLARAKAEPVLFWRTPAEADDGNKEVVTLRQRLKLGPNAGFALHSLYGVVRSRPEIARSLLLREGYLYAEDPELATAMVHVVELHHLFRSPVLYIQRGAEVLRVEKAPKGFWYEYASGPERGRRARLFLLDRVAETEAELSRPLHYELRALAYRLGFEELRVKRLTEGAVLAELRYGDLWVESVLRASGAALELECEAGARREPLVSETDQSPSAAADSKTNQSPSAASDIKADQSPSPAPVSRADESAPSEAPGGDVHREELEAVRALIKRRAALMRVKQRAIAQQVEEALPFDEPRTEIGQQDGNLRPAWIWAFNHGWDSYTFNDDGYAVFDASGRPLIPQVCIDFITDTLERTSGTWWTARTDTRQRVRGLLDFNEIGIKNRRSVQVVADFAYEHPELFDVYELPVEERHPFIFRDRFFGYLHEHRDRFRVGDVVTIHGPRNNGVVAWHSFFVYETDPITGMPTLVAGNAGKPRIRTWENELRSSPRRSIKHRLRPRLEWLESFITPDPSLAGSVPELSSSPG